MYPIFLYMVHIFLYECYIHVKSIQLMIFTNHYNVFGFIYSYMLPVIDLLL